MSNILTEPDGPVPAEEQVRWEAEQTRRREARRKRAPYIRWTTGVGGVLLVIAAFTGITDSRGWLFVLLVGGGALFAWALSPEPWNRV